MFLLTGLETWRRASNRRQVAAFCIFSGFVALSLGFWRGASAFDPWSVRILGMSSALAASTFLALTAASLVDIPARLRKWMRIVILILIIDLFASIAAYIAMQAINPNWYEWLRPWYLLRALSLLTAGLALLGWAVVAGRSRVSREVRRLLTISIFTGIAPFLVLVVLSQAAIGFPLG